MTDLAVVTEVRVVHVDPGDVIWLRVDDKHLTAHQAALIRERAKEIWPDNEVCVGANIDVAVVRPA